MMIVIRRIALILSSVLLLSQIKLAYSLHRKGDFFQGSRAPCTNEGEEVALNKNLDMKCFRCVCQNGFVECEKNSCPAVDDCYTLVKKSSGTCCDKCRECYYKGKTFPSGHEWRDPDDPCLHYKCIAGVVTESLVQCYSPCSNPLPPRPGECCPTCLGCKLNGQNVDEVTLTEDPCVKCQCNNKRLTCIKKACPVLQCPPQLQYTPPDSCCKKCSRNISYTPMKGGCLMNGDFFPSMRDKKVKADVCSTCTCYNETSICTKKTCPVLDCSPHHQQTLPGECCPTCRTLSSELVQSTCTFKGLNYKNNETWNLGPCKSCECRSGEIRCAQKECPKTTKCKPNERLEVGESQCCAKCVEIPAVCSVFVPHYKTFDGKFFSFQRPCKYQLAADCVNHTFSIRITNDAAQQKKLSGRAKTITFKTANIRINLGQKLRVKVNGTRVELPHEELGMARIFKNRDGIVVVETSIGIKLTWDGYNFLQLEAPVSYKGKLCGLCGNYNAIWRDDLMARSGHNLADNEVRKFADSWRVGGEKACSGRPNVKPQHHRCVEKKKRIEEKCLDLKAEEYFGNCLSRVNPDKYLEFCKSDMCECPNQQCYCESFTAYAYECMRNGIDLPKWRRQTRCELNDLSRERAMKKNKLAGHISGSVRDHGGGARGNKKQRQQHQDELNKYPELLHRQNIPKVLISSHHRTPPPLY